MTGPGESLFSREEVLEGLPARRAAALLFLIESRTGFLVARSRQAMERFLTEDAARERERAFIEAFALGRDAPLRATVQDLERFAPHWASLVPDNPRVRAALAHLLGSKYRLIRARTAGIQAAGGWGSPDVAQAYQRLHRVPIDSLFAERPTAPDRIRWAWAALVSRLESLPPFWTAFSLTLTEAVGAGVMALPIALASIGPLGGLVLLVSLGLVNIVTIMAMSEAVARSGTVRYGNAYIGRVVSEFLGGAGAAILTVATVGICASALLAYYIGFSLTLAHATTLPPWLWAGVLFAAAVFFLSRGSLDTTVASALLVGAINVTLVLALSGLAVLQVQVENLLYVRLPFIGSEPFDPSLLSLAFGVVLVAYFGHLSVSNCARVVLARDPGARSLIWGTAAAQVVTIVLYGIWVLAVGCAVRPEVLAAESGTALAPLVREIGPVVLALGTVFVVLAMGMASIHYSLGLFNLVQERLQAGAGRTVSIPRQTGTVVLYPQRHPDGHPRLSLTFIEREDAGVRLRIEIETASGSRADEALVRERWDSAELQRRFPEIATQPPLLRIEVLDAWSGAVRLRIDTPLSLAFHGVWEPGALAPQGLLDLAEPPARIMRWIIRRSSVNANDAGEFLGWKPREASTLLEEYAELGLLSRIDGPGEARYRARLGTRRADRLPAGVWDAIAGPAARTASAERTESRRDDDREPSDARHLGARGRFLLGLAPTMAIFLAAQWLFFTGQESFSKPLGYVGAISVSVLGGIFPVLLLHGSRRRGERTPAVAYKVLGHPAMVTGIYTFFLLALVLHGTVIWQNLFAQGAAILAAVVMAALTISLVWRRAFAPRAVLELRQPAEPGSPAAIVVTDCGQRTLAEIRCATRSGGGMAGANGTVPVFADLDSAMIHVSAPRSRQLKIWVHRVTPENESETLPAAIELKCGGQDRRFELRAGGDPITVPLAEGVFTVTIRPTRAARTAAFAPRVPI